MCKRLLVLLALVSLPLSAFAQSPVTINAPREDATAANADRGIPVWVKRCDTASTSASADGKYATLCSDSSGQLRISGPVSQAGPWSTESVVVNTPTVTVDNLGPSAAAAFATSACRHTSTASTNAVSCTDGPANFYGARAINTTTTPAWLHIYNTAGTPTCNASIIETIPIPAASAAGVYGGVFLPELIPTNYTVGIGICITLNADGTGNAPVGVYVKVPFKE